MSKAKKARDPFLTCVGDLGTQMPVYLWIEYGKSAADYAVTEEKFWKSMGEEGAALSEKNPGSDQKNGFKNRAIPARPFLRAQK